MTWFRLAARPLGGVASRVAFTALPRTSFRKVKTVDRERNATFTQERL
jgi:hypothetical protein